MDGDYSLSAPGKSTSGGDPTVGSFSVSNGDAVWEIEEEEGTANEEPQTRTRFQVGDFDFHGGGGEDAVYVAVGRQKEKTSMDALVWTLDNLMTPSTLIFLIHILPETKFIPTPLGKIHVSQVNDEQKANHKTQQRSETTEFLQKFITVCSARQVEVETVALESDDEAKGISNLINILKIRKLVIGIGRDDLRKLERRKGGSNGVADEIMKSAGQFCEVKIVCEGRDVSGLALEPPRPPTSPPEDSGAGHGAEASPEKDKKKPKLGCFFFR